MVRRTNARTGLNRMLGLFSLGLGATQALRPDAVSAAVGIRPTAGSRTLMRAIGLQELSVGSRILAGPQRSGPLWVRVAGDAAHLALLNAARDDRGGDRRWFSRTPRNDQHRLTRTIAAVAGVAAIDLFAALRSRRGRRGTAIRAHTTLLVNRPPDEVYRRWRDLDSLPQFMAHLQSVERTGNGRSHWVARGPAGRTVEWDAEIVEERPGELLAWRSVERTRVPNAGHVHLRPARDGQATELTVDLEYEPPAGRIGKRVAALLGEEPQQQLRDDLRRFKQVAETGEIVRSHGTPEGTLTRRLLRQRAAQPLG